MGLTKAQRYNKRSDEIFDYARKIGAIDDKVTCTKCMRTLRKKDINMFGRCKKCDKEDEELTSYQRAVLNHI